MPAATAIYFSPSPALLLLLVVSNINFVSAPPPPANRTYDDACTASRDWTLSPRHGEYPVRFAVYSDSGRAEHTDNDIHKNILRGMYAQDPKPDFVLHCGDVVNTGRNPILWDQYINMIDDPYCDQWPFFFTLGGHDRPVSQWSHRLSTPHTYYSFDWGKHLHFLMVDTTTENRTYWKKNGEQYTWLKEDIESTAASPDSHWMFVCQHEPRFSSGWSGCVETTYDLAELYGERRDVAAIFQGHDHNYERMGPFGGPGTSPVWYLIGGGGQELNIRRFRDAWSKKYLMKFHFLIVDVLDERTVKFKTIEYDDPDRILDRTSVDAEAPLTADPKMPSCISESQPDDYKLVPFFFLMFLLAMLFGVSAFY